MPADDMYPQPLPGLLIELDARNRASLGKLARHRRYLANLQPDGTIVLTPARIVPAKEAAHLDHTAVVDELADLPDDAPKLAEAALVRHLNRMSADALAGQPPPGAIERAHVEAEKLPTVGRWSGQPVYAGPLRHPLGAPEAELPGGAV